MDQKKLNKIFKSKNVKLVYVKKIKDMVMELLKV